LSSVGCGATSPPSKSRARQSFPRSRVSSPVIHPSLTSPLDSYLLSLITSLEVLFTRQGASIAITLGESIAFVLVKGLAERKRVSERIKAIHELRSKISHGGNKAINDDDLDYLRTAVFYVIQEMVRRKREFETKKDLLIWIDDRKLS